MSTIQTQAGSRNVISLSDDDKSRLFWPALAVLLATAAFGALATVLNIPKLAAFPGAETDPLMKAAAYQTIVGWLTFILKAGETWLFGPKIETMLGTNRSCSLRTMFNGEIRRYAFWGGALAAGHAIFYYTLVESFAPAALGAASRAVMIILVVLELSRGIITCKGRGWIRLIASLFLTLVGVITMVWANGVELFKSNASGSVSLLVAFGLFLTVGNVFLALAEMEEYHGVHAERTSAPIFTWARYFYFALTGTMVVLVWGTTFGDFSVAGAVVQMCLARWFLIIPIVILGGLSDLLRISLKPILPGTFLFVGGSASLPLAVIFQTIAALNWPVAFKPVSGGLHTAFIYFLASLVIVAGMALFPHNYRHAKVVAKETARAQREVARL